MLFSILCHLQSGINDHQHGLNTRKRGQEERHGKQHLILHSNIGHAFKRACQLVLLLSDFKRSFRGLCFFAMAFAGYLYGMVNKKKDDGWHPAANLDQARKCSYANTEISGRRSSSKQLEEEDCLGNGGTGWLQLHVQKGCTWQ